MSDLFGHVNQNNDDSEQQENIEQQQDNKKDKEVSESQSVETQTDGIQGKRYSVGIDLGTTHCVLSYVEK